MLLASCREERESDQVNPECDIPVPGIPGPENFAPFWMVLVPVPEKFGPGKKVPVSVPEKILGTVTLCKGVGVVACLSIGAQNITTTMCKLTYLSIFFVTLL